MRIDDLLSHGFSKKAVDSWKANGLEYLLPLQAEAIVNYGLLDNRALLISAPTSSGKTFCGELTAVKAVMQNSKAIILMPLKALAAEEYFALKKRYRPLGIKVIIVSADYPSNKEKFQQGDYDIAVVVYEMFNALTVSNLALLEQVSTVVFDEFQLIATGDKGITCEAALAKVRYLKSSLQFVGLIGGLDDCRLFADWLDIPLLKSTNRPVELRSGVLFNGRFIYSRFSDSHEGIEYIGNDDDRGNCLVDSGAATAELFSSVKAMVGSNEQVLIFVATRVGSSTLAQSLAEYLNLDSSVTVLNRLQDIPDTIQKASLIECLKKGVAFHNADLGQIYRQTLEEGFREGDIRVMVCTSTLAMGVNLPSKNVFIQPEKYYGSLAGSPILKPLLPYDYNQIAGRAGRYGKQENFGRAIIIAADDNDRERIRQYYIDSTASPRVDLFDTEKLAMLTLHLINCGLVRDYNDIRNALKASLRGFCEGYQNKVVSGVIDFLNIHGFITLKGCRIISTPLGMAAARHNIELNTAASIKDGFYKYKLDDSFISWLFYLTGVPECRHNSLYQRQYNFEYAVLEYIKSIGVKYNEEFSGPLAGFFDNPDSSMETSRLRTLAYLLDSIQSLPTIELETKHDAGWGRLKKIGEFYANVMRAVAEIGESCCLKKSQAKRLALYADCLYECLPEKALPLASLKVPGLERDYILRLNGTDIYSAHDAISAGYDILLSLIPESIGEKLFEKCLKISAEAAETSSEKSTANDRAPIKARRCGNNYEVTIDGTSIQLQTKLYAYFQKLYNASSSDGWVDKNRLDNGLNQVKYIYKLRKALEPVAGLMIESDSAGRYRLILKVAGTVPESVQRTA